jgi:thiosulfate dehydrogenase
LLLVLALAACGGEDPVTAGGRAYDKWWTIAEAAEPVTDHPLWAEQATNERGGATTWRCKECHGWDYRGAAGAYGPDSSHYTGFPGIFGASSGSDEELLGALTASGHDFSLLGDEVLGQVVDFIQEGMIDFAPLFDPVTKAVREGDLDAGERLFTRSCGACHGSDGREINFGDESDPTYVAHIAQDNPWEFAHKMLHGQPGSDPEMPAMLAEGWGTEEVSDVTAFAQTLPTEYRPPGE